MGIGVNVEGKFAVLPQVIPVLDASSLLSAEQGAQGILAIIGRGTGLIKPKTLVRVDVTSGEIDRLLVPGSEILQAAHFAISPSRQVPGVSELRLITVNPAVQSAKTLQDTTGSPVNVITLTSLGYGAKFNGITVQVDNTAKVVTLKLDLVTETFSYGTGAGSLAALVALINARSGLVSAALLAAGNETLATIAATALTGGSDGSPVTQDFTDVFNILAQNEVNLVCLIDSSLTNQTMLADHCEAMRRTGFCGYTTQTGWTVAGTRVTNIGNLKTRAGQIGSDAVHFNGIGSDGQPSYISIAKYAGIVAGIDPSVPWNNKDLAAVSVETDLTIDEVSDLLDNGVAPPFRRLNPNRPGWVISDGISTWTADDNLFHRIGSVRRGALAMERDIVMEVDQFLGQEATEVTIGRAVTAVNRRLQLATQPGQSVRIVSFDANATRAEFSSTVLRIFYTFTPILPIRFVVPIGSLKPTTITRTIEIPLGS